jgi:hypothetical protein
VVLPVPPFSDRTVMVSAMDARSLAAAPDRNGYSASVAAAESGVSAPTRESMKWSV